jgi:hypothetical protein
MGVLSAKQVDLIITKRCKEWWDMYTDNEWVDILRYEDKLQAYIGYFKVLNDTYLKHQNPLLWIQLDTILCDLCVCLDVGEASEDFDKWAQCFGQRWYRLLIAVEEGVNEES